MATYSNIYIDQGSTYSSIIDVKDNNKLPFNLTGYQSRGQIRKSYSSANATVFATNINLPLEGKVAVSLTAGQTRSLKAGRYIYDVEIFNDGGHVVRIAEGQVEINPGIANDDAIVLPPTPTLIEIIDERIDERIGTGGGSGDQTITLGGDASGSGTGLINVTLAATGVAAGTYGGTATANRTFAVDSKGRITAVGAETTITPSFANITDKPTTLSGYGITDAASSQAFRQSLGDSGDGNGYNTLQLHPDESLSSSDRYLIVDPTSPGHIHIRAGGTQDDSNAELYLGAEKNYVRVIDGQGIRIQNETTADVNFYSYYDPVGYTSGTWYTSGENHFLQLTSTDSVFLGHLEAFTAGSPNYIQLWSPEQPPTNLTYVPGTFSQVGDVYTFQVNEGHGLGETQIASEIVFGLYTSTSRINYLQLENNDFRVDVTDDIRMFADDYFLLANTSVDTPIVIATDYNNNEYAWNFNADGSLRFPDSTSQTTAYQTGQTTVLLNADSEIGATGYILESLSGNVIVFAPEAEYTNSTDHNVYIPAPSYAGHKLSLLNVYAGGTVHLDWPTQSGSLTKDVPPGGNVELTAFYTPQYGLAWWVTCSFNSTI